MQLLAPDILEEVRGVSIIVSASAFAVGFLLWLLGWRGHRFWIVLAATVLAGILGLYSGAVHGAQPLVAGLLLAVAAGVLALAMVRVVAFTAGGIAAWVAVRALAPSWDEPLICFLGGGLIGLLLFRIWTMALTSCAGTLLMAYAGLGIVDHLGKLDAVALAQKQALLLNCVCGGVALLGLTIQFLFERRRGRDRRRKPASGSQAASASADRAWWDWGPLSYRRAG